MVIDMVKNIWGIITGAIKAVWDNIYEEPGDALYCGIASIVMFPMLFLWTIFLCVISLVTAPFELAINKIATAFTR